MCARVHLSDLSNLSSMCLHLDEADVSDQSDRFSAYSSADIIRCCVSVCAVCLDAQAHPPSCYHPVAPHLYTLQASKRRVHV